MRRPRVLFLSESQDDARFLSRILRSLDVNLTHAQSLRQVRARLVRGEFTAVLCEATLPDCTWTDVLEIVRETSTQLIVTDRQADARLWSEALNLGAYDLLAQPFYEPEVKRIFGNVCRPAKVRTAV